jgi:spermidine synthase
MSDLPSPRLLELPCPFLRESGVLRLIEPAASHPDELYQRILDGIYDKPFILEDGELRQLCFHVGDTQSAMRISDPHALDLVYTQYMMAFLLFNPQPRRIALLGLGGGSLPKYCYRYLPGARVTSVESNRDVIALRNEFLIPHDDPRFSVIEADAGDYVAGLRKRVDVLMVDAFDRWGIPSSLGNPEFYRNARRCISPGGIFVINLAGDQSVYLRHLEWIHEVFGEAVMGVLVDDDSNCMVFARKDVPAEPQWRWLLCHAQRLEELFGLSFRDYVRELGRSYRTRWPAAAGIGSVSRQKEMSG